jgi:uncharacterized protein YegL
MRRSTRKVSAWLVAALITAVAVTSAATTALGQGGTVSGSKTLSATDIQCDGSLTVTLTLDAQTGLAGDPEDIVLVLDRSGSMAGAPLAALKVAASQFVDIIDLATDGLLNGVIANGSRVGVVSFSATATVDQPLTTDALALKTTINALTSSTTTNHTDAIETAQAELAGSMPTNTKQMIIFTDGVSEPAGANGLTAATNAKAAGTEIFAIGLGNSINVAQLQAWASDPDATHVFIAPTPADLDAIFEAIGAAIVVPAATNITVVDTVDSHFSVSGAAASKGIVNTVGNVVTWTIDELGTETVTLTFTATHDATKAGGVEQVNDSVTYTDAEGHVVAFNNPSVNVRGCAATIDLTPEMDTNELTTGASHTVTATVRDDFGAPVSGIDVDFSVFAGPNAGPTGSGTTDAAGETTFTYAPVVAFSSLGLDGIRACFENGAGDDVCDTARKLWVDTTAPTASCSQTNNPSGGNVPPAGPGTGNSGENPDGFYLLTASDIVSDVDITIYTFGPFPSGTKIKYTQAPGSTPSIKPGPGDIDWQIKGPDELVFTATDQSGNSTTVTCLVPPPPK